MNFRKLRIILMVAAICSLLAACKPTEGNYRAAYDAALAKRNQVDPDADILYGNHKLASPLGAVAEIVGTDTILTLRAPSKLIKEAPRSAGNRYRTVIAYYRMERNAVDHASRLIADGNQSAAVAKLGDEKYLVIVNSAPDLQTGAEFTASYFKAHPQGPWIGLTPPEPFLLITNK